MNTVACMEFLVGIKLFSLIRHGDIRLSTKIEILSY